MSNGQSFKMYSREKYRDPWLTEVFDPESGDLALEEEFDHRSRQYAGQRPADTHRQGCAWPAEDMMTNRTSFGFEGLDEYEWELADLLGEGEVRRGRRFAPSGRRPARQSAARAAARPRRRPPRPRRRPRPRPFPVRRVGYYGPTTIFAEPSAPPEAVPAGTQGSEFIRWAQTALNDVMKLNLQVDGVMGPAARSAVRDFQRREGLPEDGIVGPETQQALVAARKREQAPAKSASAEPGATEPTPSEEFEALFAGYSHETWEEEVDRSSSEYKRWVQQSLNKITGSQLAVDGVIGPQTRSAIRSFQRQWGLTVDGVVGPQTEAALITAGSGQPPGSSSPPNQPPSTGQTYTVAPGKEYGPHWRSRLPPGLPPTARQASVRGAALSAIQTTASQHGLGEVFVTVVSHLAQTESGATYARPADTFDARPPSERPAGKALITAWGVFQFNRDAWRALPGVSSSAFPWQASVTEEIERPIARYAELFRQVRAGGGSELAAARGVRLWHRSPAAFRAYLRTGGDSSFDAAWRAVPEQHRSAVDQRMQQIGLIGGGQEQEMNGFDGEMWQAWPFTHNSAARHSEPEVSMIILSDSVGNGGANKSYDIYTVQNLLNKFILAGKLPGIAPLDVDGKIGSKTISAIRAFQRVIVGMTNADGRVDPGGRTLQALNGPLDQQPVSPSVPAPSGVAKPLALVNTRMPKSGPGFTTSNNNYKYGVPETIEALKAIALEWQRWHPNVQFMVRDISRQGGGQFSTHKSHRIGLDADVQLWIEGKKISSTYKDYPTKWRPYVEDLATIIKQNRILPVQKVWFQDPSRKTKNVDHITSGHTGHLHIRFCMPSKYTSLLDLKLVYKSGEKKANYDC